MSLRILASLAALLIGSTSVSSSASGNLGDIAPPLTVSAWAKGGPIDLSAGKGKHIYVIEFWATWCGPCKDAIPHVTELQHRYKNKGVIFIGISNEPQHTVQAFVNKMGKTMDYAVAAAKGNSMMRSYLDAFGVDGIPHAFVIDKKGRVAWHGDPRDELEPVLKKMVADSFDTDLAVETDRAGRLAQDYFGLVKQIAKASSQDEKRKLDHKAKQIGNTLVKSTKRDSNALYEFSWNIVLKPNGDYHDLELAARAAESGYRASSQKPADKARKLMHEYLRAALSGSTGDQKETGRFDELSDGVFKDGDPRLLKDFAWALLIGSTLKHRDLNLAVRMARAACVATGEKDATFLDTYSLALFVTGKRDQAIATIQKALDVNKDDDMRERLKKMMDQYRATPANETTMLPTSR